MVAQCPEVDEVDVEVAGRAAQAGSQTLPDLPVLDDQRAAIGDPRPDEGGGPLFARAPDGPRNGARPDAVNGAEAIDIGQAMQTTAGDGEVADGAVVEFVGVEELATEEVEASVCSEVQAQARTNEDGFAWREVESGQWTAPGGANVHGVSMAELGADSIGIFDVILLSSCRPAHGSPHLAVVGGLLVPLVRRSGRVGRRPAANACPRGA